MSKPLINVVRTKGMPILKQLHLEEILLRRTPQNWLILNKQMPGLSIVLGFSGKVSELVDVDRVHNSEEEVELIRRYTGGGTVIVDERTIFTSFIMNAADVPTCKPFPRDIMSWSRSVFAPVFDGLRSEAVFDLRENDYILNNVKIGGNAQTIIKDRWVHHTSFLWDYLPRNMQYLHMPKKQPEYRLNRSHEEFLDKIMRHLETPEDFEERLLRAVGSAYEVREVGIAEATRLAAHEERHCPEKEKKLLLRTKVEDIRDYVE
jgi:lipoate-protein ligase A